MGNVAWLADCDFRRLLKNGKDVEVATAREPLPCRRKSPPSSKCDSTSAKTQREGDRFLTQNRYRQLGHCHELASL
jgi:hypothetical protein